MGINKFSLILILLFAPFVVQAATFDNSAQTQSLSAYNSQAQFTNPTFQDFYSGADISTYWPQFSSGAEGGEQCGGSQDFLVMIPPGGCSPGVVRSDLLAEQNVPVFCQLIGAKVNPLIKVSSIKSISFKGKYPDDVAGISFHPTRAAVRSYNTLLGSPVINNLGYVVIVLKKQPNESISEKFVTGNLTATMAYDAQNAFGTGSAEYYLETVNEEDWQGGQGQASFWQGRGLLRVVDVKGNTARVAVYTNEDKKLTEFNLKVGETSSNFYFPGFYCNAGIKVKLNNIVGEQDKVLLDIDGDQIWAVKGAKILDGRCTILDVNTIAGTTGSVKIRCPGSTFELSLLNSLSANIVPEGTPLDKPNLFNISNLVYTGNKEGEFSQGGNNWYLAYTGISQFEIGGKVNQDFIVLLSDDIKSNKKVSSDLYSKLNDAIKKISSERDLERTLATALKIDESRVKIIIQGKPVYLKDGEINYYFEGFVNPSKEIEKQANNKKDALDQDQIKLSKEYFDQAQAALKNLLETNHAARDAYSTYGEQGILSAVGLINDLNSRGINDYDSTKVELLNQFLELYPESSKVSYVKDQLRQTIGYDSSNAYSSVYVNNAYHTISVKEFYSAPIQNRKVSFVLTPKGSASISVNNKLEGDKIELVKTTADNDVNNPYAIINEIQPRYVGLDFYVADKDNKYQRHSSKRFYYDSSSEDISKVEKIGNLEYTVLVTDIEVKEVAQVSLISELKTRSEANFTFKIGVEERNFKINPEKAKEVSDELNKTIKKWEDKNKQLGQLLEKWKGVCLATGFGLQVKNLFGGFTGESLARQEVMKTYKNTCLSDGKVTTSSGEVEANSLTKSECYGALSDKIDTDITCYKNAIENVNGKIGSQTLEQWKVDKKDTIVTLPGDKKITIGDFYSFEDVRAYLLDQEISKDTSCSPALKTDVKERMNNQLYKIWETKNQNAITSTNAAELPLLIQESAKIVTLTKDGSYDIKNIQSISIENLRSVIAVSSPPLEGEKNIFALLDREKAIGEMLGIASVKTPQNKWKLIIAKQNALGEAYQQIGIFDFTSDKSKITVTKDSSTETLSVSRITFSSSLGKKCNYNYSSPKVKFYDIDPNKGMPAVVPFNKKGWYVLVPQSSGGLMSDSAKGYTASGVPTFYYICSVGPNGAMELKGGDDSCFSNNVNTDSTTYGGCALSSEEVSRLKLEAEEAIRKAAQQYGNKKINIPGFGSLDADSPMTTDGSVPYECEDFMSVDDCKILYNVCDPVICPSSRCNFGGEVNVPNVIQSGVVGSLLLCSKNFVGFEGGDVYVPFCLTGVHAGIDGYVSILKAQRDCMAEAAKTGKHVGICDEITSVYKCEFFWRQTAPLMQNLIPNLAEYAYNPAKKSQSNGGGEYATFKSSWDNMQKSIDYFKNSYAGNSFSAVRFGNLEEVGTEFCRSFVGTSLPNSAKAWDQLLKPESPSQFYAQFNEIPFTEATVPATSQYKVFYHIYAGKDQGARYQIYLKNPPSSSYYYNAQYLNVKTGYIAAGQQLSETKDFTSPAGYKELCVVINGREECGFKSVTTDFGLDSISASYAKDQAAKVDIKTEKECVQGSPSVYGLANLNPQAGVETATQPNIALNGIVRVCATENPGQGTNSVRWKQVGTCGADTIKCWLDETSVKDAVKQVYEGTGSVAAATDFIDKKVNKGEGIMTEQETAEKLNKVKSDIDNLKITQKNSVDINNQIDPIKVAIDELKSKAYWDLQKADAFLQNYMLYRKVIIELIGLKETKASGGAPTSSQIDTTSTLADVDSPTSSTETSSPVQFSLSSEGFILDATSKNTGYRIDLSQGQVTVKEISSGKIVALINNNGIISFPKLQPIALKELDKCTFKQNKLVC